MVKSESVVNTRERGCSSDIRTGQASADDIGRVRYRRIDRRSHDAVSVGEGFALSAVAETKRDVATERRPLAALATGSALETLPGRAI